METRVNYTIVGIFVTVLLAVIIFIGVWLSSALQTGRYKVYQTIMNESVSGLTENAPVKYNGVTVGTVKEIELNLNNPSQVILTMQIQPDVPVTETTTAMLMEQGITGIAYIGLKAGEKAPILEAKKGQKYPVIQSRPSFLVRLDQTIEKLSDNFDTMSTHVQMLLSEKNVQSVQASLENIKKISDSIAANTNNISSSLKDLKLVMQNTAQASKRFPNIMNSIDSGAKSIQKVSKELSLTAGTLNKTAKQGDIAIQSFSNNIIPITYDAMHNIKQITQSLKDLSTELKQNPSIILKGTRPPAAGPGE